MDNCLYKLGLSWAKFRSALHYLSTFQAWLPFVADVKLFRLKYLSSFNKSEIINHVEEVDQLMQIDCTSSLHYLLLDTSFGRTLAYTANPSWTENLLSSMITLRSSLTVLCNHSARPVHLLLTICYLHLFTFYWLFATSYSILDSCYLVLATYLFLLSTFFLLLANTACCLL